MESRFLPVLVILLDYTWYCSKAQAPVLPWYYLDLPDNMTGWANFSAIAYPSVKNVTQAFHRHCPFTRLCGIETYFDVYPVDFRMVGSQKEGRCCARCDCDKSCYATRTCCPDILDELVSREELSDLFPSTQECIAMQYRPFAGNDSELDATQFYKVYTKCPESYDDDDVKLKCESDYNYADIQYELIDVIPVTNIETNKTYRNSRCADCHRSSRANHVYWNTRVVCTIATPHLAPLLQNPDDVLPFIRDTDYCNLHFEIPYGVDYTNVNICMPYIDRCNITGNWTWYDSLVERACYSYTSSYKGYRNIHCFLCNGHAEDDVEHICLRNGMGGYSPSSFAAVLDFNNLGKTEPASNIGPCGTEEVFDYDENVCRGLTCPESTMLRNGACRPLFASYFYPIAFEVELRLFPDRPDKLQPELWSLRENIIGDVRNWTFRMSSASVDVCNIEMLLKFEATISEIEHIWPEQWNNDASIMANVQYLDLRIRINSQAVRNITEFVSEVYEMFENMRKLYHNWTIAYTVIDDVFFDSSNYIYADSMPPGVDGHAEWMLMIFAFDDPFDGQAVNPYPPLVRYHHAHRRAYCSTAVKLLPKHFCPKLEIRIHDSDSLHAFIKSTSGIGLNISDVVLVESDNASNLLVCYSDYSRFQKRKNDRPRVIDATPGYSADVIVSIACSLASIVCLSVTFLVYCTFPSLRTVPGINNMGLVFHLICAQTLYLVGGTVDIANERLCKVIGVLLHFMLLSSFFWMFVCTFHMLRVFVSIGSQASQHSGRYINVKYVLLAEIPAVIVIAVTVLVSLLRSDMESIGYGGQPCYISDADMIYFTVAIPLGCVIVANTCMFIFVVVTISRLPSIQKNTTHERSNILIFIKLSTITGLTWVFAFIYQWTDVMVMAYLFIIVNGCQGVFIMASFVINKRVLNLITSKRARYTTSAMRTMRTSITVPGKRPRISVIDNGMTRVPSERPANNNDQTVVSKISVTE